MTVPTIHATYVVGEGSAMAASDMWLLFEAAPTSPAMSAVRESAGRGIDAVLQTLVEEGLRAVGSFVMAVSVQDGFRILARGTGRAVTRGVDPVEIVTGQGQGMWADHTVSAADLDLSLSGADPTGSQIVLTVGAEPVAASHIVVGYSLVGAESVAATGSAADTSGTGVGPGGDDWRGFDGLFAPTMHGRPAFHDPQVGDRTDPNETTAGYLARPPAPLPDPNRTLMPGEHEAAAGAVGSPESAPGRSGEALQAPVPPPPPIPTWAPPPAAMAPPQAVGAIIDAIPDFGAPIAPAPLPPVDPFPLAAPFTPVAPPSPPHGALLPDAWSPQSAAPSVPAETPGPGAPLPGPLPAGGGPGWRIAPTSGPPAPDASRTVNRGPLHRHFSGGSSHAAPPQVQAAQCAAGHLSPAHASVCRVCRLAMPPNPHVFWTPRPVLGRMVCSNGDVFVLDRGLVLGRAPAIPQGHQGDVPNLVKLVDHTLELSSQHLEIRLDHWLVLAVDLGSTNGTDVRPPNRAPVRLVPGVPELLEPGAVVSLADVLTLTFEVG